MIEEDHRAAAAAIDHRSLQQSGTQSTDVQDSNQCLHKCPVAVPAAMALRRPRLRPHRSRPVTGHGSFLVPVPAWQLWGDVVHGRSSSQANTRACGLGDAAVVADLAWLADTNLYAHTEELHDKDA
jgi:hypothetical protein